MNRLKKLRDLNALIELKEFMKRGTTTQVRLFKVRGFKRTLIDSDYYQVMNQAAISSKSTKTS